LNHVEKPRKAIRLVNQKQRIGTVRCNNIKMSNSFKSDFLYSTAVIVVKVLAVTIKRGISGGIKARNISGPRVPCSSSFIVLHESLMNRTHCVRKIEVFPLLMGRKPPTFLNSDKF